MFQNDKVGYKSRTQMLDDPPKGDDTADPPTEDPPTGSSIRNKADPEPPIDGTPVKPRRAIRGKQAARGHKAGYKSRTQMLDLNGKPAPVNVWQQIGAPVSSPAHPSPPPGSFYGAPSPFAVLGKHRRRERMCVEDAQAQPPSVVVLRRTDERGRGEQEPLAKF